METRKFGADITAVAVRAVMLKAATGGLFDLYKIRYSFMITGAAPSSGFANGGVSVREADMVNDATSVGITTMSTAPGIFGIVQMQRGLVVEGASEIIRAYDIDFVKPFTVPYLAGMLDGVSHVPALLASIELFFERRKASQMEIAQQVISAGGRART